MDKNNSRSLNIKNDLYHSDRNQTLPNLNSLAANINNEAQTTRSRQSVKNQTQGIFTKIVPKNNYKESDNCLACGKRFGFNLLKKMRKHCKFCGNSVCDEHALKRRADPENPKNFVRVCDICEVKFLLKMLDGEHKERQNELSLSIKELQKSHDQVALESSRTQNELEDLKMEREKKDQEYLQYEKSITSEITTLQKLIKKYETEIANNAALAEKMEKDYECSVEENDFIATEIQKLTVEEAELAQKISAIQKDIQQTEAIIDDIERKVATNNMKKKLVDNQAYDSVDSKEEYRGQDLKPFVNEPSERSDSLYNQTNGLLNTNTRKQGKKNEDVKDKSCNFCIIF